MMKMFTFNAFLTKSRSNKRVGLVFLMKTSMKIQVIANLILVVLIKQMIMKKKMLLEFNFKKVILLLKVINIQ